MEFHLSNKLKVWEDNWEAICTLSNYSKELRKIMYTTNAIESLNRSYHKYTKTKEYLLVIVL